MTIGNQNFKVLQDFSFNNLELILSSNYDQPDTDNDIPIEILIYSVPNATWVPDEDMSNTLVPILKNISIHVPTSQANYTLSVSVNHNLTTGQFVAIQIKIPDNTEYKVNFKNTSNKTSSPYIEIENEFYIVETTTDSTSSDVLLFKIT